MAVFKPIVGHLPCSVFIQDYLEWDADSPTRLRAIAIDYYSILTHRTNEHGMPNWAKQMDDMRASCGHDLSRKGEKAVTYRHYIFSPDPKDNVSLETLQEVCNEWVETWLVGKEFDGVGKVGSYQAVVVYHDDNPSQVMHAHLVFNCTDMSSGYKFHVDDKTFAAMYDSMQEIAASHGLTYHVRFGDEDKEYPSGRKVVAGLPEWRVREFSTKTEREMRKAGRYLWKDDLRCRIAIARSLTTNDADHLALLETLGIERRGRTQTNRHTGEEELDYVYTFAINQHWECSGYRLGRTSFTKEALDLYRVEQKKGTYPSEQDMAIIRDNIGLWAEEVLAPCIDEVTTIKVRPDTSLKELAKLMQFNDRHVIGGLKDYDRLMKSRQQALGKEGLSEARRSTLRGEYNVIKHAKALAINTGYFENVAYTPSAKLTQRDMRDARIEANKEKAQRLEAKRRAGGMVPDGTTNAGRKPQRPSGRQQ